MNRIAEREHLLLAVEEQYRPRGQEGGHPYAELERKRCPRIVPASDYDFALWPHLHQGSVSVTAGAGGSGKSGLKIAEHVTIGTGVPLLGVPGRCGRTLYLHGELGTDRLLQQRDALARRLGLAVGDVEDAVRVLDVYALQSERLSGGRGRGAAKALRFDKLLWKEGAEYAWNEPFLDWLVEYAQRHNIVTVCFDPIRVFYEADENSTQDVSELMRGVLGHLATETNCSIDCVLHTTKAGAMRQEGRSIDARGSSDWINSARSARIVKPLSDAEAEEFDLNDTEREGVRRVLVDKSNVAPDGHVSYFRLPKAANRVAVVEPWSPPEIVASNRSSVELDERQRVIVQDAVRAGPDGAGGLWRWSDQAQDQWVGLAIMRALDLDASSRSRSYARAIADQLVLLGDLKVVRQQYNSRTTPFVAIGEAVRPG